MEPIRQAVGDAEAAIKTARSELTKAQPSSSLKPITEEDVLANKKALSLAKHALMDLQTKKSLSTVLATENPFADMDARKPTLGEWGHGRDLR